MAAIAGLMEEHMLDSGRINKMHGHGTYKWPDGRKYWGSYHNDLKDGEGTFYWPDGKKYVGLWHNGVQHGRGYYLELDGEKEYVSFKFGKQKMNKNK